MGASPNKIVQDHVVSGVVWLTLAWGDGTGGVHTGCSLGRRWSVETCAADSSKRTEALATHALWRSLVDAAQADAADASTDELDAMFAGLTSSPGAGPWPSVAPSSWWSSLTTSQREAMRDQVLAAAVGSRISA